MSPTWVRSLEASSTPSTQGRWWGGRAWPLVVAAGSAYSSKWPNVTGIPEEPCTERFVSSSRCGNHELHLSTEGRGGASGCLGTRFFVGVVRLGRSPAIYKWLHISSTCMGALGHALLPTGKSLESWKNNTWCQYNFLKSSCWSTFLLLIIVSFQVIFKPSLNFSFSLYFSNTSSALRSPFHSISSVFYSKLKVICFLLRETRVNRSKYCIYGGPWLIGPMAYIKTLIF